MPENDRIIINDVTDNDKVSREESGEEREETEAKEAKEAKEATEEREAVFELDTLAAIKQTVGKILSVDFGDTRTGLAVSDVSRFLASGIGYVSPGGIDRTAEAVAAAAKEQGAVAVIVGLPVNMDGSEGSRAQRCRKFAHMVRSASGLCVAMFDERMTTMTASRYLNETNTRGKKRKGVIDTLSAQIILQNCLDRLKYMN